MKWDVVAFTVRHNEPKKHEIEAELNWLHKRGVFETDLLFVIEDPSEGIGSGGATLNALLVLAENLCSFRGFPELTELVLNEARILILHSAPTSPRYPLGPTFAPMGRLKRLENGNFIADMPLVQLFENIHDLASSREPMTWIFGTESYWKVEREHLDWRNDHNGHRHITTFTFQAGDDLAANHGVWTCDRNRFVEDFHYKNPPQRSFHMLAHSAFCLPPDISMAVLSIHMRFPISSSTYYGVDRGDPGFKLNFFADFIMASSGSTKYLEDSQFPEKTDPNFDLLKKARKIIQKSLGVYRTRAEMIPVSYFHYFHDDEKNWMEFFKLCHSDSIGHDFFELVTAEFRRIFKAPLKDLPNFEAYLRPLAAAGPGFSKKILAIFLNLSLEVEESNLSRILTLCADYFSLLADGNGGIRSGPASNPQFTTAFDHLRSEDREKRRQGLRIFFEVLEDWTDQPRHLVRASRHLEKAAKIFTRHRVYEICQKHLLKISGKSRVKKFRKVFVSSAARIDFYGGWLDTPPLMFEVEKSSVISAAITVNGQRPLKTTITLSDKPGIELKIANEDVVFFKYTEEIMGAHERPTASGCLTCACLVAGGLVDGQKSLDQLFADNFGTEARGLVIECSSEIAFDSGMGTMSILAGTLLTALWTLFEIDYDLYNVIYTVFYVEQLLLTKAGWQNIVGGIFPGVKMATYQDGSLKINPIVLPQSLRDEFEKRCLLVYTGRSRLTDNHKKELVRNWETQKPELIAGTRELQENAERMLPFLEKGEFPSALINDYFNCKRSICGGRRSENLERFITKAMEAKLLESACPAGSDERGFLYIWLAKGRTKEDLEEFLTIHQHKLPGFYALSCAIEDSPLIIETDSN